MPDVLPGQGVLRGGAMIRLSEEQRFAVDAGPVDLFISAGAGSGKTRVLTARFVHAVLGTDPYPLLAPRAILTVTFTDRAAGELTERIRGALIAEGSHEDSRHVEDAWISTIHGMCSRILRQHAFEAGIDPHFAVASDVEAGALVHKALESAVKDGLESGDEQLYRLADAMGTECLYDAVQDLYDDVRSMGLAPADIGVMPEEEVVARLLAIAAALERHSEALREMCDTGPKTLRNNLAALEAAAEAAHRLAVDPMSGRTEPVELKKPTRISGRDEHNTIIDDAKTLIDQVALCDAQRLVRPYEEALLRLLESYASAYARMKSERSLLDFEDLQTMVAELLERRPEVAQEYRERFRMVMIDEFQDTNALQVKIAEKLADGNLCTVGDEKQSIYSFRHADIEVFRSRERSIPRSARLMDNYRSHPELLSVFNGVFGSDALFGSSLMRLQPGRDESEPDGWPPGRERARVVLVDRRKGCGLSAAEAEAKVIAEEFSALRDAGVAQGDMVLLLRKMKDAAEVFERELRGRGFDVFIASGGTYFDTQETREVTALLRLADNVLDDEAALIVLAGRLTGTSDDALFRLREAAGRQGSLWKAAREAEALGISEADKRVIRRTVGVVEQMRASRGAVPLRVALLDACERLDYDLVLFSEGPDGPRAWANVLKLARIAEEYEDSTHGDVGSFLDYLDSWERHTSSERQATVAADGTQAVRIMSVHAAKGLEFPVVGIASFSGELQTGRRDVVLGKIDDALRIGMKLPRPEWTPSGGKRANEKTETASHSRLIEQMRQAEAEEVQRLLYVACTRAERGLVLCLTQDLSKEPVGDSPPSVMRRALGLDSGDVEDTALTLPGGGRVDVRVVVPEEEPERTETEQEGPTCEEPPLLEEEPAVPHRATSRPATISYSGLDLFRTCPRRFYAERISGMPTRPAEHASGKVDPLAFGTAFHHAMREVWERAVPDAARLTVIARSCGLGVDAVERLAAAVRVLDSSPLAGQVRSAERVIAECPINAPVHGSVLVGAIDLIAWTGDEALIVDYKTGSSDMSADKARAKYELQASCYALAALRAGAVQVTVVFFEPERDGRRTEYVYTTGDTETIESRIGESLDAMAAGEFPPLEAHEESICGRCPVYGTLCRLSERVAD